MGPALFAEKRGFVSVELLDFEGNVKNRFEVGGDIGYNGF